MLTPMFQKIFKVFQTMAMVVMTSLIANAQKTDSGWRQEFGKAKCFIENRSQFDGQNERDAKVLYAMDHGNTKIYFTEYGITYRFFDVKPKYDKEEVEHRTDITHAEKEKLEREMVATNDFVHMEWLSPNRNVKVVAEDKNEDYYNYGNKEGSISGVPAFKRLRYKDLYEGIDVVFEFHPQDGIKYSFVIQPSADPSKIAMRYSSSGGMNLDEAGNLHLPTLFGDILEYKPISFYEGEESNRVKSSFVLEQNIVRFNLGSFDASKTLIIDPWVQTPTLNDSNGVWECDVDGAGNVYIIGGEMPLTLQKYSSAGALQWSFTTAYDTAGGWLGGLATDFSGNSFISNGSSAALQKVSPTGNQLFNVGGGTSNEYWSITLNCDESKLLIGGTINLLEAGLFDVDPNNGSVLNTRAVASTTLGIPPEPEEVRSLSPSRNARYYYLTHSFIGAIDDSFSPCFNGEPIFYDETGYSFSYKCENYRPNNGNGPIVAIRANDAFVYTVNGSQVDKRSLADGSLINSAAIPGGGTITDFFGDAQAENAGIDLDDCGNVYVGSKNGVHKFDENLNLLASATTNFRVSDVAVNYNGEVVVCGTTGTDADVNRTGYVQTFSLNPCNPQELICCDPNICPAGPFCETDPPVTLTAGDPGGVWSGNGITNSSTGVFDPSVSGPGVHTIIYTLPCGADSIEISVSSCTPLEVCLENNGDLTALTGTGPYTWYEWTTGTSTPITNEAECVACGYTWTPFVNICMGGGFPVTDCTNSSGWVQFTTGVTVTPPGYPIKVLDAVGDSLVINDPNTLPPCTDCEIPAVTVATQDPSCAGGADGSIDLTVNGPSTYDFAWSNGPTTEDINGLAAGSYTVTITDQNNATCDTTFTVSLADGTLPDITAISITDASCGSSDGQIDITATTATQYSVDGGTNFQAGSSFTGVPAGSYNVIVEDANGCQADSTVSVGETDGPIIDNISVVDASCGASDGTIDLTVSGGSAPYQFSADAGTNFQASGSFTGLAAGSYDILIEDAGGCQSDTVVSISNLNGPTIDNLVGSDPNCGAPDGTIDITASGGTAPLQYSIDGGTNFQPTGSFTGLSSGTFDILVEDAAGCQSVDQVTLNSGGGPSIDNVSVIDATCGSSNGQIDITASNGTPPLQFSIDNGANFQTGSSFTGLSAGTYDVIVDDGQGCPAMQQVTLNSSGGATIDNVAVTDATCGQADGQIDVTASGGTAPLQYSIDNGANFQGAGTFTGLVAGNYDIVVEDASGCQTTQAASVANSGAPVITSISATDATCNGYCDATIDVVATGASEYSVDNGNSFQSSGSFVDVCAGVYDVVVDDGSGCQAFGQIVIAEPASLLGNTSSSDATCSGSCDGTITVGANGGTPSYQFSINSGTSFQASGNFINVCDGTYTVIVEDANGCQDTLTETVSVPNPITFDFTSTDVSCFGECDGTASVAVAGGTSPYNYVWTGLSGTSASLSSVCAGSYSLSIIDDSGCSIDTNFVVTEPPLLVISDVTVENENCEGDCDGSILIVSANADSFSIDDGLNWLETDFFENLCPGTYPIVVQDANGCLGTESAVIAEGAPVVAAFEARPNIVKEFDSEIRFANNSIGAITYSWHFGDGTYSYEENPAYDFDNQPGTYLVCLVADNGQGCMDTTCNYIDVTPLFTIYVPNAFTPNSSSDLNDVFKPVFSGERPETYHFEIFDRWGERIFETDNPDVGWDGTYKEELVQRGVFVWRIELERDEGGNNRNFVGHVTIVK